MKVKSKKHQKGITLIALVITIIILLILAAVTIGALSGDNGILSNAARAKEETEKAQAEENKTLAELEELIENGGENTAGFDTQKQVNEPDISSSEETGLIPLNWNGSNWVVTDIENWEYDYNNKQWANAMLSDGTYKVGEVEVGQVVQTAELGSMFVWVPRFAYSINEYGVAKNGTEGTTQNITKVEYLKGTTNIGTSGARYGADYNMEEVTEGEATPMIVHPAFTFGGESLKGIWVAKFEASMKEENLNTTANNNVPDKTVKVVPNSDTWRYINIGNCFKVSLNMKENDIYKLPEEADTHLIKNSEWGAVTYLAASQYGVVPAKNDSDVYENGIYHSYSGANNYEANVSQSTTGNITGIYDMNGGAWDYVAAYYDNGNGNLSGQGSSDIFPSNKLKSEYEKYWDAYQIGEEERTKGSTYIGYNASSDTDGTMTEKNKGNYRVAKERVETNKNIKGDAFSEIMNTFSYYGRYSKDDYSDSNKQYAKWELRNWFTATESNGEITTNDNVLWRYGTALYNNDYVLVGCYDLPFVRRGGAWGFGTIAGVFAFGGFDGYAHYGNGFRPVVVV